MSGFVSKVIPAPSDPEPAVEWDGWFPAIDVASLREAQRLGDEVKPARLREVVLGAMLAIDNDLRAWAEGQKASGATSLADVAGDPTIAGQKRLVILLRRAVGALVKAELTERAREDAVPGPGQRRADELDPAIGELRRSATLAVRDMLGVTRTAVELI